MEKLVRNGTNKTYFAAHVLGSSLSLWHVAIRTKLGATLEQFEANRSSTWESNPPFETTGADKSRQTRLEAFKEMVET